MYKLDIVLAWLGKNYIHLMYLFFPLFRRGEVCSHVAAILFKVEACSRLRLTSTCTSLPCLWNQVFSKKVCSKLRAITYVMLLLSIQIEPATVSDIDFRAPGKKRKDENLKSVNTTINVTPSYRPRISRGIMLDAFYAVNPSAAVFTVVDGYPQQCNAHGSPDIHLDHTESPPSPSLFSPSITEVQTPSPETHTDDDLPFLLSDLFQSANLNWTIEETKKACSDTFNNISVTQHQANNLATYSPTIRIGAVV